MGILMALLASQVLISGPMVVVDGDTLRVGSERVRLVGIDAPEQTQHCGSERRVACGIMASQWLEQLVKGRTVQCLPTGRDRYGRLLAKCRGVGAGRQSSKPAGRSLIGAKATPMSCRKAGPGGRGAACGRSGSRPRKPTAECVGAPDQRRLFDLRVGALARVSSPSVAIATRFRGTAPIGKARSI